MVRDLRRGRHKAAGGGSDASPGPSSSGPRFRWVWWTTFLAFAFLGTAWNLAQPQWTGADERAHFLEAQAAWSGQLLPAQDTHTPSQLAVGILHGMTSPLENANCVIGDPAASAVCTHATTMTTTQGTRLDYVDREPPLPAFLNGWPIAIHPSVLTLYLGRFLDTLIAAAAVATALSLAAVRRRAFLFTGIVLAVTPGTVAGFGVLGTSQLEIGSALVVWTTAALLIDGEPLTKRFVWLTAASSTVLVLSRPLSFVFLGLAVLAVAGVSHRSSLARFVRSRPARIGGLIVGAVTIFSLGWAALAEGAPGGFMEHTHDVVLQGIGEKVNFYLMTVPSHWIQAVGSIGANEYDGPWWITLGWTFLVGVTVGMGLLWASRRRVVTVALLGAALIALPLVVEVSKVNTERLQWQGRYDIPTIAGIILVSCGALDRAMADTPQLRPLATAAVTLAGLLQVGEFVGGLRRYAVGIEGPLDPRNWVSGWHPPIPILTLLVLGALTVVVAYTVLGLHQRAILRDLAVRPAD